MLLVKIAIIKPHCLTEHKQSEFHLSIKVNLTLNWVLTLIPNNENSVGYVFKIRKQP